MRVSRWSRKCPRSPASRSEPECENWSGDRSLQPKRLLKQAFHRFGGLDYIRWRNRDGFRALAYHRFWPPDDSTHRNFSTQLQYLRKHYTVRPLADIVADCREGRPQPPNTLAITVDDGHRDFFTVAYPALRALQMPATVFLTTGFLDGQGWLWFDQVVYTFRNARTPVFEADLAGAHLRLPLETPAQRAEAGGIVARALQPLAAPDREAFTADLARRLQAQVPPLPVDEYAPLLWDQVREMNANGISFGAHTVTHPTLASVPGDQTVAWELRESKRRVEQETQREAPVFCYPNGQRKDIGPAVIEAARNAGFQGAVTMEPGLNRVGMDPFLLRRMGAEPVLDPLYFAQQCAVLQSGG